MKVIRPLRVVRRPDFQKKSRVADEHYTAINN